MNNGLNNTKEPNLHAKKFFDLLEDAQTELYSGCNISKLSFIIKLLHLKCLNYWSNKFMDVLLSFFKGVLPKGPLVPSSYYEAKKVVRELGLDYTKIDACKNYCILYWQDHANIQSCPRCNTTRWKSDRHRGKKIPHKAKGMRWHKE